MIEPYASQILSKLSAYTEKADDEVDVFNAALLIAALDHPGRLMERYTLHIDRMTKACYELYQSRRDEGRDDSAALRLEVLREILVEQEEYSGDSESYDRLDNADIMSVIDRRAGLPIALSVIYIAVARKLDWKLFALSFPAHVFLRIEHEGERIIFDPFDEAKIMEAHDLRQKLKSLLGGHQELSATYYEAMNNRDILVRLQNNIKTRLISGEDYDGALERIDIMRAIIPKDPRLLFEAGVLNARLGQRKKAISLLYEYIDVEGAQGDTGDAHLLIQELENGLN